MAMQTTNLTRIQKLMELYYQPLFRFARRLCGSPAEAMLLTQRTFRVAFDCSRAMPGPINNRAWLFAILFNKFLEGRLQNHNTNVVTLVSPSTRAEARYLADSVLG